LGPIEYVINTPRQHVNHHARAPGLCNTNYAGVLSIWDQMFGTFDLENKPDKFGIVVKPDTFDPVENNLRNFTKLFDRMSQKKGIWEKLKVLGRSGRYELDACQDESIHKPLRYNPILSVRSQVYSAFTFVTVLFDYLVFSASFRSMPSTTVKVVSSLYLVGSLMSLGQYLNKNRWSKFSETCKHGLLLYTLCVRGRSLSSVWSGTVAHTVMEKGGASNFSLPWSLMRATLIAWSVGALVHLYTQQDTEEEYTKDKKQISLQQ